MVSGVELLKRFPSRVTILIVTILALAGCVSKPIYNVDNRSFSKEAMLPIATVQEKIKIIGSDRGWVFEDVAPGHMIGSVGNPKHNARVNLNYTEKTFSITYLDSQNLRETEGTIHHRYNRWIEFLERDLVTKLGLATVK